MKVAITGEDQIIEILKKLDGIVLEIIGMLQPDGRPNKFNPLVYATGLLGKKIIVPAFSMDSNGEYQLRHVIYFWEGDSERIMALLDEVTDDERWFIGEQVEYLDNWNRTVGGENFVNIISLGTPMVKDSLYDKFKKKIYNETMAL